MWIVAVIMLISRFYKLNVLSKHFPFIVGAWLACSRSIVVSVFCTCLVLQFTPNKVVCIQKKYRFLSCVFRERELCHHFVINVQAEQIWWEKELKIFFKCSRSPFRFKKFSAFERGASLLLTQPIIPPTRVILSVFDV